ncbi:MAG TPA: hypothetical protein VME68_12720 [Acidobacteriaceae bacterium]|nr:hypothetical protein [Acidobacteriaceae bacterium]
MSDVSCDVAIVGAGIVIGREIVATLLASVDLDRPRVAVPRAFDSPA